MLGHVKLVDINSGTKLVGTNEVGMQTYYDASTEEYTQQAPTPMEVVLQSVGACSALDVIAIIKKKRKQITDLEVKLEAERRSEYPKTFTTMKLKYILTSPDAEEKDLLRAVELSQEKYCNVSIMLKAAGVDLSWEAELIKG